MSIRQSPRGTFFIASYGRITVFDRDRQVAMSRLLQLIWPIIEEQQ